MDWTAAPVLQLLLLLLLLGREADSAIASDSSRSWRGWTPGSSALGRERLEPAAAAAAVIVAQPVKVVEGAGADMGASVWLNSNAIGAAE